MASGSAQDNDWTSAVPLVALATLLVPGSGYLLINQRGRGLTIGITIIVLFILGLLIGGVRIVEAPDFSKGASIFGAILAKPWFIGQALTGLCGIIAALCAGHVPQMYASHARMNEIGTLYTAVAGMLNLLAVIDAAYRASHHANAPGVPATRPKAPERP